MIGKHYKSLGLFLAIGLLAASCNKKLMTVLVEDPAGNVELIYAGTQSPDNLVKEVRYYPNGDTLMVTPMRKGAVDGKIISFYKNNLRKEEITFKKGVQNGLFRRFDKEGVIVFEGEMKNGQKDGVWTTWYDEVQVEEQRTYQADQPHGKWSFWYIDGELRREEVYDLGKLIDEKDYN